MEYLHPLEGIHYDRFSKLQKRVITAVISMAGIIGPFASASFIPCITEIAKDLNTSGTVINYTVGAYVFMLAFGNLVWAPYAEFYGRQPVYLISLPLVCVGALCSAMARNVFELLFGRCLQAFGASCVLAVGAATISDIYRLEERGTAMGIFFGAILLGPPLAPLIGGILATYASWRIAQLSVFLLGLLAFLAVIAFLPETSHPGSRGIDKLDEIEGEVKVVSPIGKSWASRRRLAVLNPFKCLRLCRGPVVLSVSVAAAFALTTFYFFSIPLAFILGPSYGIKSPMYIGACFFPSGAGSMAGAMLSGRLSDYAIIKGRRQHQGKWMPEDRLRAATLGAVFLLPLSLLVYGYTVVFIPGRLGLIICLACLFVNGMGVDIVLSPVATYLVDIFKTRSVEAMAVYTAFRSVFCAVASAAILPVIESIGIMSTYALAATFAVISYVLLIITITYGHELRAWKDVGYTCPVNPLKCGS